MNENNAAMELSECMMLHDEATDGSGSPDGSSSWDSATNFAQDLLYNTSDVLEKFVTASAKNALKEETNKLLGGGGNNPVKSDNGMPSKNDTDGTSATQKTKGFLATPIGAGILGTSVATGTFLAVSKKNKHRMAISLLAGIATGAGTYYATQ